MAMIETPQVVETPAQRVAAVHMGFQTGRFAVEALKRGVVAAARWDAFDAHYQTAPAGDFSMLKKASPEWAPTPSFPVMQLLGEAAPRGWKVVGVDGDDRAGLVAPRWPAAARSGRCSW